MPDLNPLIVWPLAVLIGLAVGLWVVASSAGYSLDAIGYFVAAALGAAVGHLIEARHPAHFGPHV